MIKKKIFSITISILIIASGLPILSIISPATHALNTNEADILSMDVIENVTILDNGEAQIVITIIIPSSPLANLYRNSFNVQNCTIGEEIGIPENITIPLDVIIGENFSIDDFTLSDTVINIKKSFYEEISKEQQVYFGFPPLENITSKMIPRGHNNEFKITVNATSYTPVTPKSNGNEDIGWKINIGTNEYQSSQESSRITHTLGHISYTKQLLNSIPGENIYIENHHTKFCFPSNAQADIDNVVGLNWALDFGGETIFHSSVDSESQEDLILEETIQITEDNQSAPIEEVYQHISDYQSFEVFCAAASAFSIEDYGAYANMLNIELQGSKDNGFHWEKTIQLLSFEPHEFTFLQNQGKLTTGGHLNFTTVMNVNNDQNGLENFEAYAIPHFEASANIKFNGNITIKEKIIKWDFFTCDLPFRFFVSIIPVWGKIKLTVSTGLEISAYEKVSVEAGVKVEGKLKIGVEYNRDTRWGIMDSDPSLNFNHSFNLMQSNVEVALRPSLTPRIAVIFYSSAGPFLEFDFYGLITMKNLNPDDPDELTISSIKTGIDVNVGITTGWILDWLGKDPYTKRIANLTWKHWTYKGDTLVSNETSEPRPFICIDDDFYENGSNNGYTWNYDAFDNINDGIRNVSENGTIYIYPGIYYEHIVVDKPLFLVGENTHTTILDGCGSGNVVTVTENGILTMSDFTIRNGVYGLFLDSSSNNNISNCNICNNSRDGIYIYSGTDSIDRDDFWHSWDTSEGDSDYNPLFDFDNNGIINSIDYTEFSEISVRPKSNNNVIYQCSIHNNSGYGINCFFTSFSNTFYHNKFIDNDRNAYDIGDNNWDKDHIIGGNYWDDYTGSDNNNDGLGDIGYGIDGLGNTDRFPLMSPGFIPNKEPIAEFSFLPQSPFISQEVTFNSSLSFDPDGEIVNWTWYFGDGNISYEQNPSHRYNNAGLYIVRLIVTDDDSAKSYQLKIIFIKYSILENFNVSDTPFNIVQVSDPHISDTNQISWQRLQNVISVINDMRPHLVLVTGDLVDKISNNNFIRFNTIMDSLSSDIDVEYIVGNHDIRYHLYDHDEYCSWYHYYINPQSDRILVDKYYSSHGYIFLGLNSNQKHFTGWWEFNDYSGEINGTQLSWLYNQLTAYESAKQIIIYMHHPVFSDKTYLGEDSVISDNMLARDFFIDYCGFTDEYGNSKVSLVLTGHTHENGVWEKDGKSSNGHYYINYKEIQLGDDGYYHNLFNKKTKFIYTTSVKDDSEYRLIQLHGENAVYRTYDTFQGNPLPVINNIFINSSKSGIEGEYSISARINSGASSVRRVKCYWSTDEITWQTTDMDFVSNGLYQNSIFIDYTNHSDCINIHYKVAVENYNDYIAIKEGNYTDSITVYPSVIVYPAVQSVEQGNDFCIQINVNSNGQAVQVTGFQLTYPTIFTVKSFTYEALLGTNVIPMGTPLPGDNSGFINYAVSRTDGNADPMNGKLVTICFTAPATVGTYPLDLHDVILVDESGNPLVDVVETDATIIVNTSIDDKTTVYVDPSSLVSSVENSFTVNIYIDPAEAVSGAQLDISFDPALLSATSVTNGGMFDMWYPSQLEIDNVAGEIRNIIAFKTSGSISTSGVFATLHFTSKTLSGMSSIILSNLIVGNPEGEEVTVIATNGTIILVGDITSPVSSVNTITLYGYHLKNMPLPITVSASDIGSGVKEVSLYYRYSTDNSTWTNWILYGINQTESPYTWFFTAPDGAGFYEFYSQALDNEYNREAEPVSADVFCSIYPDWDVNMDQNINILDIIVIAQHIGETGEPCWIPQDVNCDGTVNVLDIILVAQHWTG